MSVAKEGYPFIAGFFLFAVLLAFLPSSICRVLSLLFFVLSLFSTYFFRDPEVDPVFDPHCVLAPGNGRILDVSEEENALFGGKCRVVKIFLSVFDVHIQRAPISGKIGSIEYQKGKFLDARDPRASLENEKNSIVIENNELRIVVTQIAGFIARRIVCWVRTGQSVGLAQRLGLIRFGSQVDLYMPMDIEVCVSRGDRVVGGLSVVAVRKNALSKDLKLSTESVAR